MGTTKTDICNGALTLIGEETITNFDTDTSEEADACRVVYDRSIKVLLGRTTWRFAQKTVALTADVIAVNPLYSASFQLPADFLEMAFTNLDIEGEVYIIEGQRLLTNATSVTMTYTSDAVDEGLFSAGFVRSAEYLLASRLAYRLTKDRALAQSMLESYELVVAEESNKDSVFGVRNQQFILDDFISPRQGALGGTAWDSGV